jgi:hypothetical protein
MRTFFSFRKFIPRLGGLPALQFFQEIPQHRYNFLYINCQRNYLINTVDNLFRGQATTMFLNQQIYVIHLKNKPCAISAAASGTSDGPGLHVDPQIMDFLRSTYSKQKYLPYVFNILGAHALFDKHLFFTKYQNIHIADFCAFLNNSFGKPTTTEARFLKLCKYLQSLKIKLPKIAVKNPVAVKYLCA